MKEVKQEVMCQQDTRQQTAALTGAIMEKIKTNIKQWLFIKVKLNDFTFKTGNRRGCNNVIRK